MIKSKKQMSSKRLIGISMFAVALIMPLAQLPQIRILYTTQVTTGLSIETWVMYLLFGFVPLMYAYINKLVPLILSNILWTIVDLVMIAGILKFNNVGKSSNFSYLVTVNSVGKIFSMLGFVLLSTAFVLLSLDLMKYKGRNA